VAPTTKRLASLVTVLAISGAPTVLAACAALCVPGTAHAAAGPTGLALSAEHAAHRPSAHQASPAVQAHQHQTEALFAAAGDRGDCCAVPGGTSLVTAPEPACCSDAQPLVGAAVASGRADAGTRLAAPMAAASPFFVSRRGSSAVVEASRVAPRSPARAPLVLRI
jgi:hypothetical protein